jgi:hypothetical protein
MWLKLYGSVMYCELCELLTSPDQTPGSPLIPQTLRPIASSAIAATPIVALPNAQQAAVENRVFIAPGNAPRL